MVKRRNKIDDQRILWEDVDAYSATDVSSFAKRSYNLMRRKGGINNLLEIGCGLGYDAVFFAKKGLNVIAIDFSRTAINHLKELKNKEDDDKLDLLLEARVKNITKSWSTESYCSGRIDAVFANKSIHYFDHKTTNNILQNIHKILKPEGYLFVCVHSAFNEYAGKGKELEKGLYRYENKIRRFFEMPCLRKKYLNGYFEILSLDYSKEKGKVNKSFLEVIAKKSN